MRIYLSGPITNIPAFNQPAFDAAAKQLRGSGHEVVNPHELVDSQEGAWGDFMRRDLKHLLDCDAIHMLPGWERSRGATLELHVATQIGMQVFFERSETCPV